MFIVGHINSSLYTQDMAVDKSDSVGKHQILELMTKKGKKNKQILVQSDSRQNATPIVVIISCIINRKGNIGLSLYRASGTDDLSAYITMSRLYTAAVLGQILYSCLYCKNYSGGMQLFIHKNVADPIMCSGIRPELFPIKQNGIYVSCFLFLLF